MKRDTLVCDCPQRREWTTWSGPVTAPHLRRFIGTEWRRPPSTAPVNYVSSSCLVARDFTWDRSTTLYCLNKKIILSWKIQQTSLNITRTVPQLRWKVLRDIILWWSPWSISLGDQETLNKRTTNQCPHDFQNVNVGPLGVSAVGLREILIGFPADWPGPVQWLGTLPRTCTWADSLTGGAWVQVRVSAIIVERERTMTYSLSPGRK